MKAVVQRFDRLSMLYWDRSPWFTGRKKMRRLEEARAVGTLTYRCEI